LYVEADMARKPTNREKCQSIYWNLLELLNRQDLPAAHLYIRDFFETSRCDQFKDFKGLRQDVVDMAGRYDQNALSRVLDAEHHDRDEDIMQTVQTHYHTWHKTKLVKSLEWMPWIQYHTVKWGKQRIKRKATCRCGACPNKERRNPPF